MRLVGSDVKTASTASTATAGVALTQHRSRLKGYIISGGTTDGTVTFRDGSVHAVLANLDRVTIFHA